MIGAASAWVKPPPALPPEPDDLTGLPLAILLSDQQLSFDNEGWTEYRQVQAKVQGPAGLQALTAIPFQWSPWSDTLTFHHARILRDGQVIDILPKDGAFTVLRREAGLEQAMLTGVLTALLQPEGLQVGDVLDIAVSIRHADPLLKGRTSAFMAGWDLAPTGVMRLQAHWPAALAVRWKESAGLPALSQTTVDGVASVGLDLKDMHPLVLPAHAPPRFLHGRQVEFTTLANWKQVAEVMAPLYVKAAVLTPGSPVAALAAQIVKGASDPKARASAALQLVQGQVRYLAHTDAAGGYVPQTADETWRLRYGDCKAKTVLLLALLQALGVPAEPVLVSTTLGDGLDAHLPSAAVFDHVLVRARLDGRDYWLDGAREGDRGLDTLSVPAFGWVLPLYAPEGGLVHIAPQPAAEPLLVQIIRYDASGGVTAPEPTHLETTFRGDIAVQLHAQLAAVSGERVEAAVKAYWAGIHTAFKPSHVAASWDPTLGEEKLTGDGTSKLDWSGSGLEFAHVAFGGAPDIKRDDAAIDPDAPYTVSFPFYVRTDESVVLPPGDTLTPQIVKTADVDMTLAGSAYRRTASITGQVFRVVATQRSLQPEISAAEARASVTPLTKLGETGVYAPAGPFAKAANDAAAIDSTPTSADDHGRRGNALLDAGRYKEALTEFDAEIALDPKSQLAWSDRAIAHASLGDTAATADADKADSLGPPDVAAARARGVLAWRQEDFRGARAAYRHVLVLAPGDEFALTKLIDLDIAASDPAAARADLDSLMKAHPDATSIGRLYRAAIESADHHKSAAELELAQAPSNTSDQLLDRAGRYLQLDDKMLARADVDAANRLKPSVAAWMLRASIDGGYPSATARADVDAAIKLAPTDLTAQVWIVDAAISRNDYATALSLMDKLIDAQAEAKVSLIVGRAEIESQLGLAARADADFAQAQTLTGDAAPDLAVLCNGEVVAKWRPERALESCEKALQAAPNNTGLRLNKALLLHRLGRSADVAQILDGVEATAGTAWALNNICYGLAKDDLMLDRALADCDAALKLQPDAAQILDSRAFTLMRLGRDQDAVRAYDAALAANPKEANSLYGRALVERRQGHTTESARDMAAALALSPVVAADFEDMGLR